MSDTPKFRPGDVAIIDDPTSPHDGRRVWLYQRCLGLIAGRPYWKVRQDRDGPADWTATEDSLKAAPVPPKFKPGDPVIVDSPGSIAHDRRGVVAEGGPSDGGVYSVRVEGFPTDWDRFAIVASQLRPATIREPEVQRWRDRLVYDFDVSDVSPVVKGTSVTTSQVASLIVDGRTWAEVLLSHPELTEDDIRACLSWACEEAEAAPAMIREPVIPTLEERQARNRARSAELAAEPSPFAGRHRPDPQPVPDDGNDGQAVTSSLKREASGPEGVRYQWCGEALGPFLIREALMRQAREIREATIHRTARRAVHPEVGRVRDPGRPAMRRMPPSSAARDRVDEWYKSTGRRPTAASWDGDLVARLLEERATPSTVSIVEGIERWRLRDPAHRQARTQGTGHTIEVHVTVLPSLATHRTKFHTGDTADRVINWLDGVADHAKGHPDIEIDATMAKCPPFRFAEDSGEIDP